MLIDAATLRDLDVLSPSTPRGQTLLQLVDRTRTRLGQEHLRRRLKEPAGSPEAILEWQRAHQALAADAGVYRAIVDRAGLDDVERYLNSKWRLPRSAGGVSGLAAGHWRVGWRARYLADAEAGQRRVTAFLDASAELRSRLARTAAGALRDVAAGIVTLLGSREARELGRLGARGGSARLAFDRLARGTGRPCLVQLLDCAGLVEALWSLGVATQERGWAYPTPSSRLHARALCHPFLRESGGVSNDLLLDDEVRVCFVTGPNMAGKSTFLKAVAVAMLLAHAGCGVPAASLEFPVVGSIFSSVRVSEDIAAGESFYLAEVRRIKALGQVLHRNGSALAVLDEPLRGTNVHDAAEATLAVMTRLARRPDVLAFIASHISELVPAIAGERRIRLLHFAADLAGEDPRFDYQLREGFSAQRLGLTLLRREQVLDLLEPSTAAKQLEPTAARPPVEPLEAPAARVILAGVAAPTTAEDHSRSE